MNWCILILRGSLQLEFCQSLQWVLEPPQLLAGCVQELYRQIRGLQKDGLCCLPKIKSWILPKQ